MGRLGSGLQRWAEAALDLALPRCCPQCGGPSRPAPSGTGTDWCVSGCAVGLIGPARSVRLSEAALDAAAGLALPPVRALTRYRGGVRAAILAGKERDRADLPVQLGTALGVALLRSRRPGQVWIVPAPTRAAAARRRGGDPVLAMARAAARRMAVAGVPAGVAPCLATRGAARDSVGLAAEHRVANLAGRIVFRASAGPAPGQSVVLIDDVVTSGATMVSGCATLAAAGIGVSVCLAVASAAPWIRPG